MPETEVQTQTAPAQTESKQESTPSFEMPEKFKGKSAEDIAKSYLELEKKIGSASAKKEEPKVEAKVDDKLSIDKPTKPVETTKVEEIPDDADVPTILSKVGVTAESIVEEYTKNGKLTEEQYAAFKAKGFSKAVVNTFIEGSKAKAELVTQGVASVKAEAAKIAGGEEQLQTLRTWAANNIDAERLKRLNAQVEADHRFYPEMVRIIESEYRAKNGISDGEFVGGGSQQSTVSTPKNIKEFNALSRRAAEGDAAARRIIMSTPDSTLQGWMNG